jgi:hypothetical protein
MTNSIVTMYLQVMQVKRERPAAIVSWNVMLGSAPQPFEGDLMLEMTNAVMFDACNP